MLKPDEVAQMRDVHTHLFAGNSVEATAEALEMSVEDVKANISTNAMMRYKRFLKATSRGLDSTANVS